MLCMKLKTTYKKERSTKYTKASYQCLSKKGQLSNGEKKRREKKTKMIFTED